MGFGKAFGIGLVVFIVMNLVWIIIQQLVGGTGLTVFSNFTDPGAIITTLFGAASIAPFLALIDMLFYVLMGEMLGAMGIPAVAMLSALLMSLYYMVPAIITAIICGRMAQKGGAFGAMLLIMILSGILLIVATMMLGATLYTGIFGTIIIMMMSLGSGSMDPAAILQMSSMIGMLFVMLSMIVNGIFYGGIAAVSAKSEGY